MLLGFSSVPLIDGPLGASEPEVGTRRGGGIRRIQRKIGTTTIAVIREQQEALAVATPVEGMRPVPGAVPVVCGPRS